VLSDEILDRIDAIVLRDSDVGRLQMAYHPPAVLGPALGRRPIDNGPLREIFAVRSINTCTPLQVAL
jgi:hypothetical protein